MEQRVYKSHKKAVYSVLMLMTAFCMTVIASCTFEPAWKTQRKTSISISFAPPSRLSAAGRGAGRALASDSGYLYVQTGQTSSDASMYGPYQASAGKTLVIADIPAGDYSWLSLVYSPVVLPDPAVFTVSERGLEGFAAAVLERVAVDPSLSMGVSCAAVQKFSVIEGRENVLSATLVPVTDATVNGSVALSVPGSATGCVDRFVRLEPGFDSPSFAIQVLPDSDSDLYSLASYVLYDSKGAYLDAGWPAVALSTDAPSEFTITRPADAAYYLYLSFTAPSISVIAALPPEPLEPGPAPSASSFMVGTGAANVSVEAQTLTLELDPSENGIIAAEFTGLVFSAMTGTLDGTALTVSESAGVVSFDSPVYDGGTLVLSGASLPAVDGTHTITCTLTDAADLSSPSYEATVVLDRSAPPAPTSLLVGDGTGATTLSAVPLSFVLPASVAGIKTVQVSGADASAISGVTLDGTAVSYSISVGSVVLAVPVTSGGTLVFEDIGLLTDSTYTVGVSLIDTAGRIGSQAVTTIIRDTAAPVASLFEVNGGLPTDNATVGCQLTVQETGSGISRIEFAGDVSSLSGSSVYVDGSIVSSTVSGLSVTLDSPVSGSSVSVNVGGIALAGADGNKNVNCTVYDDLGQASSQVSATVVLDATAPAVSGFSANSGLPTAVQNVTCIFTGTDTFGFNKIAFSGDVFGLSSPTVMVDSTLVPATLTGLTLTLDTPTAGGTVIVSGVLLSVGDGTKTVSCTLTDSIGNVSTLASDTVLYDTTAPTVPVLSFTGAPNYPLGSTVYVAGSTITVNPTSSDSGSGVQGYALDSNAGPWTASLNAFCDGNPHEVWVIDNVGNLSSYNFTPIQDANYPTFLSADGTAPTLTTDINEAGSGIATVEVFYYPVQTNIPESYANYSMWAYSTLGMSTFVAGTTYSTTTAIVTQTAGNYVYFRIQMTDRVGNVGMNYFWRYFDGSFYTYSGPNP